MEALSSWWPQLAVTSLAGIVNAYFGYLDLESRCRHLPLLQPYRNPVFLWFVVIRFGVTFVLFWALVPKAFRIEPPMPERAVGIDLIATALAFGWGSGAILNAPIDILQAGMLPIKPFYDAVLKNALYAAITKSQKLKTAEFWTSLRQELSDITVRDRGFMLLDKYLSFNNLLDEDVDEALSLKADQWRQLKNAQGYRQNRKKAEAVCNFLDTQKDIDRRDLPEVLMAFGCRPAFIQRYFPKKRPKR